MMKELEALMFDNPSTAFKAAMCIAHANQETWMDWTTFGTHMVVFLETDEGQRDVVFTADEVAKIAEDCTPEIIQWARTWNT